MAAVQLRRVARLIVVLGCAVASACDATGGASELRERAAELYSAGDHAAADACIAKALAAATVELELLAAQAQALRSFRAARQQAPTVAPDASGCVVDASGAALCLPAKNAWAVPQPMTASECGSEEAAITLLSAQFDASAASLAGAVKEAESSESEAASTPLDVFIVQSAQRHWVSMHHTHLEHTSKSMHATTA